MIRFNPLNHIKTAVAVIDKDLNIVDANDAFKNRCESKEVIGNKCYKLAYNFNEPCNNKDSAKCPVQISFKTGESSSTVHNFWIENNAVVEEVTTTPVLDDKGAVEFVVEEFRDMVNLLGLKKGLIGICSYCRKIRNNKGEWVSIEEYLRDQAGVKFTHSICTDCNHELQKKLKESD